MLFPLACAWVVSPEMGTLSVELDAAPYRGRRVRVEGWMLGEQEDWASVWARVDGKKSVATFDNGIETDVRGDGWTRHRVELDVTQDAKVLAFGVLLSGNGPVKVDDLTLKDLGPIRSRRAGSRGSKNHDRASTPRRLHQVTRARRAR